MDCRYVRSILLPGTFKHDCTGRVYHRNDMQHVMNITHESQSKYLLHCNTMQPPVGPTRTQHFSTNTEVAHHHQTWSHPRSCHLTCSQNVSICNSNFIIILRSIACLQSSLFLYIFLPKLPCTFIISPCMLHALPISCFLMLQS